MCLWAPLTFRLCTVAFGWDAKGRLGEDFGDVVLALPLLFICQSLLTVFGRIPSLSLEDLGSIIGNFMKRQG